VIAKKDQQLNRDSNNLYMPKLHTCIFCLKESDEFNIIEHIVPESLGNTEDLLTNTVCDKCQNYFGKEIESFVLSKTPFGFWKTVSGTKNKKDKLPYFDASQTNAKSGRLKNFHPYTDNGITIYPVNNESIIEVSIKDDAMLEQILSGKKTQFNLVLTPKMLIYIGRFLGKVALEYWCKEFGDNVLDTRFNELRHYVRYGTTDSMWPILRGQLSENILQYKIINGFEEEQTLYSYSFLKAEKSGTIVFTFDVGCERYGIILNYKNPDSNIFTEQLLSALCKGTNGLPDILFYNL